MTIKDFLTIIPNDDFFITVYDENSNTILNKAKWVGMEMFKRDIEKNNVLAMLLEKLIEKEIIVMTIDDYDGLEITFKIKGAYHYTISEYSMK